MIHFLSSACVCVIVCLFVRSFVRSFVCLLVCCFAGLLVCLFACLLVCLFACLLVCLFACLLVCLFAGLFVCFCLFLFVFVCICNLSCKIFGFSVAVPKSRALDRSSVGAGASHRFSTSLPRGQCHKGVHFVTGTRHSNSVLSGYCNHMCQLATCGVYTVDSVDFTLWPPLSSGIWLAGALQS